MKHRLQAFMPGSETKTARDYLWLLPDQYITVYDWIGALRGTGFSSYSELCKSMKRFYSSQVLEKAGIETRYRANKLYSMRTARATRATEWIMLIEEYRLMGWEPAPLNPL